MKPTAKRRPELDVEPVRVLGRGLRAQRGIHLSLRALREAAGKTQGEVSAASGIDQADVSRLETRERFDDCQVSTLQRYLAALGAEFELVAVFGDKRIAVVGAPAASPREKPANTALQRTGRKAARR
jgi:transcriptional regulator with XRE-family HTH domain